MMETDHSRLKLIHGLKTPFNEALQELEDRTKEFKREINIHECGHALVARILGIPIAYVTNVPKTTSNGHMRNNDADNMFDLSKQALLNHIAMNTAGVMASDLVLNAYDREHAYSGDKKTAFKTIQFIFLSNLRAKNQTTYKPEDFIKFAALTLRQAENRAKGILSDNMDALLDMADALEDLNVLDQDEVDAIIGLSSKTYEVANTL